MFRNPLHSKALVDDVEITGRMRVQRADDILARGSNLGIPRLRVG